ncbi:hypothetical protein [Desulforhopalus sp. IMCC35007]|uniref:hypothetical protein n=1 Tax=Desulforhopalus sp. IMCC35007 TaxID=2569543 RepID=UPI0010AEC9C6|nr:hypothetical protein [Desulforhopalus sp. IMCC35007]TKB07198.1 hypothetical protein FCL48_18340 [Desulforhopalus sp. IMCC35007]
MLHSEWKTILIGSFICVAVCYSFMSCYSSTFYKKIPAGRLNHSQLLVKQGNANFEQRINVFVVSLLFSITNHRILIAATLLAIGVNFALLALQ